MNLASGDKAKACRRADGTHEQRRQVMARWVGFIGISIAFGVLTLVPRLAAEFRRLPPLDVAVLCSGTTIALLWFVAFATRHFVAKDSPIVATKRLDGRPGVASWIAAMSLTAGSVVTLVGTFGVQAEEETAFHRALRVVATGTAHCSEVRGTSGGHITETTWVDAIHCEFQSLDGKAHVAEFVLTRRGHLALPAEVRTAVKAGAQSFPIVVAYDPERPERCWLPSVGLENAGFRIHGWMGITAALQLPLAAAYLLMLIITAVGQREMPWWADWHWISPMIPTAFLLLVLGFCQAGSSLFYGRSMVI